ncbi:helix-turn-helix domain-containing protein [Streptomyces sp. NRRL B-1677]|uniref:helix-turn-helix domain-containing protein n=1 Tax=Streptomyces sp. NRRL B-1677 TaxID=2682966 RepID=UPI00189290D7|nr:helix-turn-helix transcriptional regulator [Streptomyces sp. NRRL B-1677]MBF6046389.1 helix-turn-helix domain-containing protein [Streptomyces sp. NRRL B-1677]
MGQRPVELTPNASPQHYLGAAMRARRTERGLSLARLQALITYDYSYMARAERGRQAASAALVEAYDQALNAGGALVQLHRDIQGGADIATLSRGHVAKAEPHVANGRTSLAEGSEVQALSDAEGIAVPCRTSDGRIIFVSVPRRVFLGGIGAAAVGLAGAPTAQASPSLPRTALSDHNPIEHLQAIRRTLIDADNLFGPRALIPKVQEQINAITALRDGKRGADRRRLLQVQTQFAELAGWFHQDAGDHRAAQYWTDRALQWSHMAGDPDLTVYILARKSQLAGDMRDPVEAVDVAEAAEETAQPRTRLAAVAATYAAHGHALRGDEAEAMRAYDHARDLLHTADPDPESNWGVWLDDAYIDVQRARSLSALGNHGAAAAGFRTAIRALPAGYHRDHGVYLAREASAHAGNGDAEQAAGVGLQALSIGVETGSARILTELAQLDSALQQWKAVPSVREFHESLNAAVLHEA